MSNENRYYLGFDEEGKFSVTSSAPFFGWEILFVPEKKNDEKQEKYEKRVNDYLNLLFARVYPAVMPYMDDIAKAARKSAKAGLLSPIYEACCCLDDSFYDIFCGFEAEKAIEYLDFFELEKFAARIAGRIDAMDDSRERLKINEEVWHETHILSARIKHDADLAIKLYKHIRSMYEGRRRKAGICIIGNRKKFCSDWEKNWDILYNRDRHLEDWYGPMRGRLNMDVSDWEGMIAVFRMLEKKITDRRAAPFEHMKIEYPKAKPDGIPLRESIEEDVTIVLSAYGMSHHPAMWTISRKRGNRYALHILLSLAPMPDDKEPLVVEMDMRVSGKPVMRANWEGCRQAAAFRIAAKYGFPVDGLSFDAEGKRIGPVNFDRYNTWVPL